MNRELLVRALANGAGPDDGPLTIDLDSTACETYGWPRRRAAPQLRRLSRVKHSCRFSVVLALVPSPWEQRLTDEFCWNADLRDYYMAVESRETLEEWERAEWIASNWAIGRMYRTLEQVVAQADAGNWFHPETPERKRDTLPHPERMVNNAPAFGISPAEKRALDLVADHPMIPLQHLARWLGVSDGRVSQMTRSLAATWGLVEQHGRRGDVRYTLSEPGIRYVTRRDRAQLTTTMAAWSTEETTDSQGRPRPLGHRILTWKRQTDHADGITWFLSELAAEARADEGSKLQWHVPTARADRAFNRGDDAIAPGSVGHLLTGGLHVPFCFEHELRVHHPRGGGQTAALLSLLPIRRSPQLPAPIPDHAVRGGHGGGGRDLLQHGSPDGNRVAAHPGVQLEGPVRKKAAGRVLASLVGTAQAAPGAAGTGCLRVGWPVPTNATAGDASCGLHGTISTRFDVRGAQTCNPGAVAGAGSTPATCHFDPV